MTPTPPSTLTGADKNRQVLTKKVQEVAKQYDCPATHSCKLTRIKWLVARAQAQGAVMQLNA